MRHWARQGVAILAVLALTVGSAWAWTGGTNISVSGGTIALTGQVGVANGGTGVATLANHGVVVGQAASAVAVTAAGATNVPLIGQGASADPIFSALLLSGAGVTGVLLVANGGTNSSAALAGSKCMRSSAGAIVEAAADCAVGGTALLGFGSGSPIAANSTVFLGPGSGIDTTEGVVQTVAANAATFKNLNCVNNAIQGSGASHDIVITMRGGACGSQADKTMTCTITGSASANQTCTADTTNAIAVTAGQCFDWKVVTQSAVANPANVNCSAERTA